LKDFAGQTVKVAFYFYSVQSGSFGNVSSGWYIDDIEIISQVSTNIFNLTNSKNTLYMFPNPAYSSISIKPKDGIQIIKINLFDLNGVLLKDVVLNRPIKEYQMDLNDIKNGIYIIQLFDNFGDTYYSKLIKE